MRKDTERAKIARTAELMTAVGVTFGIHRVKGGGCGGQSSGSGRSYIYRMEIPRRFARYFETATRAGGVGGGAAAQPTRYVVWQALDQGYQEYLQKKSAESRRERFHALNPCGRGGEKEEEEEEEEESSLKGRCPATGLFRSRHRRKHKHM